MTVVGDDERIRKGLKFITRSDKVVIRSSVLIEKLAGNPDPPGIAALMARYSFSVAGNNYGGEMTKEQDAYLQGYLGSLATFADAIARVLIGGNDNVVGAINKLGAALGAPMLQNRNRGTVDPDVNAKVGCCTYDTDQQANGMTQTYCEGGLQGEWSQNPCVGREHIAPGRPSPRKK